MKERDFARDLTASPFLVQDGCGAGIVAHGHMAFGGDENVGVTLRMSRVKPGTRKGTARVDDDGVGG